MMCRRYGAVVELGTAAFEHLAATRTEDDGVRVEVRHLALPARCAR